jgi:hypothetical protein
MRLSFTDYDALTLGTKTLQCSGCEKKVSLVFNPGDVKFVLKDGESGGWASKAVKENAYRAKRHKHMGKVQDAHAPKTRLLPNFAGDQTDTWKEARAMAFDTAYQETKDLSAAKEASSTYDSLVTTEGSR